MLFTRLGGRVEDHADFTAGTIGHARDTNDAVMDITGLDAFVPPVLHEVSDGYVEITQMGVTDVGYSSGAVLRSFE